MKALYSNTFLIYAQHAQGGNGTRLRTNACEGGKGPYLKRCKERDCVGSDKGEAQNTPGEHKPVDASPEGRAQW